LFCIEREVLNDNSRYTFTRNTTYNELLKNEEMKV
jgi:hypothetical protein